MPSPSRHHQLVLPLRNGLAPAGRPGGRSLEASSRIAFVEMACRSVLNWVQSGRIGDFYSANPYRGCELGCLYCYARYTHDFLDLAAPEDFEQRVYVKMNAPEAFARDLKHAPRLSCGIHVGSATDPYQPAEARFQVTRKLLEKLAPYRGIPVSIATKSVLVERDVELLRDLSRRHTVKVVVTCITLDAELQRALEPHAAPTERRLAMIERLASAGIATGLLLAPVLPALNDAEADLAALANRAREAGARSLATQVLFLPKASKRRFLPWLQERFPALSERYVQAYRGRELQGPYREVLRQRLARVRAAAGFDNG